MRNRETLESRIIFWLALIADVNSAADPENVPSYLDLIFVGRALERIGDHATNIGEDTEAATRVPEIMKFAVAIGA